MKINEEKIKQIREQFQSMKTKEDLVLLMNTANEIIYGEKAKPFDLKLITYYANPEWSKKRYKQFTIKKKSGEDRIINAPVSGLKSILKTLNFIFQCLFEPHHAATGFVPNKSIVDNARKHIGQNYVYNIDLKDFFHSFDRNEVKLGLMYAPFNLNGERKSLAFLIASLCTHPFEIDGEIKYVLPQGSPTSPTLTNLLSFRLDRRLNGLSRKHNIKYSRYADDITFSSMHNVYNDQLFISELHRIIAEVKQMKSDKSIVEIGPKLRINEFKTRLQKEGFRQEVTGLIVNEKVNVRRRYIKQLRMWLYYWEKYGYVKAEQIFKRDYKADKGHIKKGNVSFENVIDGKLEFLKMVKGENDSTFLSLKNRFSSLIEYEKKTISYKSKDLDDILKIFATKGLEKAMEEFKKII